MAPGSTRAWWLGLVLAAGFALVVTPAVTAERWLLGFAPGAIAEHAPAAFTVRAPALSGYQPLQIRGGVVIARGEIASRDQAQIADAIAEARPRGPAPYAAVFGVVLALGVLFRRYLQRTIRFHVAIFAALAALVIAVKALSLLTAVSTLVVPVAAFAMISTLVLDRSVGLATGVLAALIVSLAGPFDAGLALLLLVQAVVAGLVMPERPARRWLAVIAAGAIATGCTAASDVLITGQLPSLGDPMHAAWLAAALGPALAALITVVATPLFLARNAGVGSTVGEPVTVAQAVAQAVAPAVAQAVDVKPRPARDTETISLGPAERIDRDPARAHAFAPVAEPRPSMTLPAAPPPPAGPLAEDKVTVPRLAALHAAAVKLGDAERRAAEDLDASVTEPSLPTLAVGDRMRLDTPLRSHRARPTAEVDPDDIEAAIEVAPPARRAVIKPRSKKRE